MAQTIVSFSIVEVAKPNIGENWPARVRADITVNLNVQDHIKAEWEGQSLSFRNTKHTDAWQFSASVFKTFPCVTLLHTT